MALFRAINLKTPKLKQNLSENDAYAHATPLFINILFRRHLETQRRLSSCSIHTYICMIHNLYFDVCVYTNIYYIITACVTVMYLYTYK